jgi:hypothetical protein
VEAFLSGAAKFVLTTIVRTIVWAIMTVPVWLLWNAVAEEVPQLPTFTYHQAFALYILAQLVFDPRRYMSDEP